ncbi:MAG: hypothetical protein JO001_03420 [Alphaproteobacteria bacterium]|nr:hypothetical protein [Alphaproteobacteria bacterium]
MAGKLELEADVVDAFYRGACDRSELRQALECMRRLLGGAAVVFGEKEFGRPGLSDLITVGVMDEPWLQRYPPFAAYDPLPDAALLAPAGSVLSSARIVPREDRRRNPFINEFLLPVGVRDAIATRQPSGICRGGMISVMQGIERAPFDNEDSAVLGRLAPHFGRVLQIRRLFNQTAGRAAFLSAIVDRGTTGIIALSNEGPALFINRPAELMASAGDGLTLDRNGRLIVADRAIAKQLTAFRADVLAGGAGGLLRVPRISGRLPYVLLVARLPTENELFPSMRRGVLIAIHDPARTTAATEQKLADLLRLPRATARLVCALLEGEDLRHYAERTGISMNTARFHLKSAFARTETHSQAELVRQALMVLSDLGSYFEGN